MSFVRVAMSVLLLVFLLPLASSAEDAVGNMASMITKLGDFIEWPADRSSEGNGSLFVISVVGDSPLYAKLKEFNKKDAGGGATYKIRKVPPDMIPSNSHVLLISGDDEAALTEVVKQVKGTGTVTITSGSALGGKGAVLNIYDNASKVQVEIDAKVAKAEKLQIKPSFLKLAKIINADG